MLLEISMETTKKIFLNLKKIALEMETRQLEWHTEACLMTTTGTGREIKKEGQQWTQKINHCTACNA